MSLSNVPHWSLCFEVWYYVAFGLFLFAPRKYRWFLVAGLPMLLWPKVTLLFPLWLLGVFLYHWRRGYDISEGTGWLFWLGSMVGLLAFAQADIARLTTDLLQSLIGPVCHREVTFVEFFIGDYLLGPLIFLSFLGFRRITLRFGWLLKPAERRIRYLVGFRFSIYILHQTLILFFAALFDGDPAGYGFYPSMMLAVAASVWLLSLITERRTGALRGALDRHWEVVMRMLPFKGGHR